MYIEYTIIIFIKIQHIQIIIQKTTNIILLVQIFHDNNLIYFLKNQKKKIFDFCYLINMYTIKRCFFSDIKYNYFIANKRHQFICYFNIF